MTVCLTCLIQPSRDAWGGMQGWLAVWDSRALPVRLGISWWAGDNKGFHRLTVQVCVTVLVSSPTSTVVHLLWKKLLIGRIADTEECLQNGSNSMVKRLTWQLKASNFSHCSSFCKKRLKTLISLWNKDNRTYYSRVFYKYKSGQGWKMKTKYCINND